MVDLFNEPQSNPSATGESYTAADIEVLEGLEPVRRRPGMYIGGTDDRAFHHLAAEVLDNAMDEAVAGHATRIEVSLEADGSLLISVNGRGIPVDPHPKRPELSALEVILTTLHSGGKFSGKAYATSGGLHGVGISVVNALSVEMTIEVAREKTLWRQTYSRGVSTSPLANAGAVQNRRGTTVRFLPDPQIFGEAAQFRAERLYAMARSKAYLFKGVEIRWRCAEERVPADGKTPTEAKLHFPNGLADHLASRMDGRDLLTTQAFFGEASFPEGAGRVEWAIAWAEDGDGFQSSYCNTIPTPDGGSHEQGLRSALTRSLKAYGELAGNKRAAQITAEDVIAGASILLSVFIRDPQFQGQTKERLATPQATRLVDQAMKDRFDLYLAADPASTGTLMERIIETAEERQRRRKDRETARKTATRRLRLPGKLADCATSGRDNTEIFIVEGDSAGGSAKQARDRNSQAILPLRGKILNVASASADKLRGNKELADLVLALGCGAGRDCDVDKLRYERVIIMTDADVDGAHIAALLMTFFFKEMAPVVESGSLYLALPPLYRLAQGGNVRYARDDAHKDELMQSVFTGRGNVEVGRFKGLGEMPARELKETTMDPAKRTLVRIGLADAEAAALEFDGDMAQAARQGRSEIEDLVERLMGRKAEARFQFIQDNAPHFAETLDI